MVTQMTSAFRADSYSLGNRTTVNGEAEDANNPDFTIQVVGAILKGDNKRRFKNPEKAVLEKNTGDVLNRF